LQEETGKALHDTESLIRRWHGKENDRLRYNITPRFGITCSDELLEGCRTLAEKYKVLITTHASESQFEVREDKKKYKKSTIEHFYDLGLLGSRTLLVHCVWVSEKEIRLLAKTRTKVAHCPGSNMMLASGAAPICDMLRTGIEIGLGSDVGAYYNLSMFDQMRLSVLLRKATTFDPVSMDHKKAFMMATKGGAKALGINSGALQKGKNADISVLSTLNYAFQPTNDLVAQTVFCGRPDMIRDVVCDGKILMRDSAVLVANEEQIIEKAKELLHF
jgi:cytosine/adenosine deaminase-related metal-dependent hydrolase